MKLCIDHGTQTLNCTDACYSQGKVLLSPSAERAPAPEVPTAPAPPPDPAPKTLAMTAYLQVVMPLIPDDLFCLIYDAVLDEDERRHPASESTASGAV